MKPRLHSVEASVFFFFHWSIPSQFHLFYSPASPAPFQHGRLYITEQPSRPPKCKQTWISLAIHFFSVSFLQNGVERTWVILCTRTLLIIKCQPTSYWRLPIRQVIRTAHLFSHPHRKRWKIVDIFPYFINEDLILRNLQTFARGQGNGKVNATSWVWNLIFSLESTSSCTM